MASLALSGVGGDAVPLEPEGASAAVEARVRWWPLAVAVALVEVLAGAGVLPVWAGLAHEVALPPLGLVTDLRLLLSRAGAAPWFALGLAAALCGRVALLWSLLGWSRRRLGQVVRFYLVALLPCALAAVLLDAGQVSLYAMLFWVGLGVLAVTALALLPLPWRAAGGLGGLVDALRHGRRLPTVLSYLVALVVLGGATRLGRPWSALGAVVVSALLTGLVAHRLTRVGHRPLRFRLGAVGVAAAAALTAALLPARATAGTAVAPARSGSLLLVPGIDTWSGHGTLFNLDPRTLGYGCGATYYFSYGGAGGGVPQGGAACPIRTGAAYVRADTERPLGQLVSDFRAQLAHLPGPVTVVTHSSGSWVAWAALASSRGPTRVRDLVLLSPLTDPLGFPTPARPGPGAVGADGARLVTAVGRWVGFSRFRLDAPLATELFARHGALAALLARPLPPGVAALAVPAGSDVPLLAAAGTPFPRADEACPVPASHTGVATSAASAAVVNRFLAGRPPPGCPSLERWAAGAVAGFRVPDPGS